MASIVSNSGWNLLAFLFFIVSNFLSLPLVISWLGLSEFGKAGLIIAFWAPLSLIGAVFGQTATRELAVLRENKKLLFETLVTLSLVVSFLVSVVFYICGLFFYVSFFGSNGFISSSIDELYLPFFLVGVSWFLQQQITLLQSNIIAQQNFRLIAKVAVISSLLNLSITLAFSYYFRNAIGYLIGYLLSFAATLCVWVYVSFSNQLSTFHFSIKLDEVNKVFRFGGWQFINQLFGSICNQVDKYLIGVLSTPVFMGLFTAVNRLQEAAYMALLKVVEVLFPYFVSISHYEEEEKKQKFIVFSWFVMVFSLTVLAPVILLSNSIIMLWLGADTVHQGSFLLNVLILSGMLGCGSNVFSYYMMGTGDNSPVAFISMIYSILTIIFSAILFYFMGERAAGIGMVISSFLRICLVYPVLRFRVFKQLTFSEYFLSTLYPIFFCLIITYVVFYFINITLGSWVQVFFAYGFIAFLYLLLFVLSGLCFYQSRSLLESLRLSLFREWKKIRYGL